MYKHKEDQLTAGFIIFVAGFLIWLIVFLLK